MKIRTRLGDDAAYMTCRGSFGVQDTEELDEAIAGLPADVRDITLDLAGVNYLSSAGLKSLIAVRKLCEDRGGTLRLHNPSDEVMSSLDMCNLTPLFEIRH